MAGKDRLEVWIASRPPSLHAIRETSHQPQVEDLICIQSEWFEVVSRNFAFDRDEVCTLAIFVKPTQLNPSYLAR